MGKISKIFMSLICLLSFATSVSAASYSSSITANQTGDRYEYITGLPIYYNKASSYGLYLLDTNTYFTSSTKLSDPIEVDGGFAYIINNSDVTNSTYKNYYIAQIAILWYEDYLNGNNKNISSSMKESISSKTSDTVCYYITKLVNNAKNYSKNGSLIKFVDDEITFTRNGNYYYSNVIEVSVNGLNSKPSVTLHNAPSSSSIINNNVSKNGIGTFQIRIPVNSINNNSEEDFIVNVTGKGYNYTYYKYNYNGSEAIYGRSYSSSYGNEEASMVVKVSEISDTYIRINLLDNNGDYISGIKYNVYKNNCSNSTCDSDDLVYTFTTRNTYTELNNVLNEGIYTLVRMTNNNNYELSEKEVIYVNESEYLQTFNIDGEYIYDNNVNDNNINNNDNLNNSTNDQENKYSVKIYSDLNDSTNIIKIFDNKNVLLDSYRSNEEKHTISLYPGKYSIVDTNASVSIDFEIKNNGDLYITVNGYAKKFSSIKLSDFLVISTKDEEVTKEETEEDIYTDENGNVYIENLDGVESIEIKQNVETSTTIEWLSEVIDCPITSLSSTIKYIIGAIILSIGILMVVLNVKKHKNNI